MPTDRKIAAQVFVGGRLGFAVRSMKGGGLDMVWSNHSRDSGVFPDEASPAATRFTGWGVERFLKGDPPLDPKAVYERVDAAMRGCHANADPTFYLVCNLYLIATYFFTAARAFPYLNILGPIASGKTVLAERIEDIAFNGQLATNVTTAALLRLVEVAKCTFIFDEDYGAGGVRVRVLRAGYRSSGAVVLLDKQLKPTRLCCFSPKIFVTSDDIADDAIRSRTLRLITEPAHTAFAQTEMTQDEIVTLRDDLHIFALQNAVAVAKLNASGPAIPAVLNREQELGSMLLAVACQIDRCPGDYLGLTEHVTIYLDSIAKERRRMHRVEGEREWLSRLLLEFVDEGAPVAYADKQYRSWYLAQAFWRFLNEAGATPHQYNRPEELGRKLRLFGLIEKPRVVDIVNPALIGREQIKGRVQRTVYRFNRDKAEEIAAWKRKERGNGASDT